MKKTYWWRAAILFVAILILSIGQMAVIFENFYNPFVDSLMFLSLSLLVVSLPLFFVRDDVFRRWSRFALVWMIVSVFLIAVTPEYSGGWSGNYNPNREQVSVWLAALFPIVSGIKLIYDSRSK